jgi:NAD(P)-dependent dehydrogenase (short-subunit alcohol dehydrogenase family)
VTADLAEAGAAEAAVAEIVRRFGGLDILVSNAGYAPAGNILTMPEADIRASFEVNFFAHLGMARAAAAVFARQGTGGQMLFNVSKQAVNPGKGFGAYGLPKAATFFLVRQLALELGAQGIRVNGVNADRIRSGLLTDDFIDTAPPRGASRGKPTWPATSSAPRWRRGMWPTPSWRLPAWNGRALTSSLSMAATSKPRYGEPRSPER